MIIHLINTGSELMLGRVLNTHQQWLCRLLADRGRPVDRQVAVADSGPAIEEALRESMPVADLILVTGGLGPTSDDCTRDLIAGLLGCPLHEDPEIVAHIERLFAVRRRPMPASTRRQALVPRGATVLPNAHGTAPGLVLEAPRPAHAPGLIVMLPGPPRELRPMFLDQVLPLIEKRFPLSINFLCRTLKTTGLGESQVEEKIAASLRPLIEAGLELGYCARTGEVDLRLAARGHEAARLTAQAEAIARELLGAAVFGVEDETLEQVVIRQLTERRFSVALAESCTGGFIAHRLTNVPGASAVFLGGLVTYSNEAKQNLLGVQPATLAAHGAVSEATAREMAEGARRRFNATFALAVTGIAGPGGGTPEKPVGTVWMALAAPDRTLALQQFNAYDRETFKLVTSQQALNILRRAM